MGTGGSREAYRVRWTLDQPESRRKVESERIDTKFRLSSTWRVSRIDREVVHSRRGRWENYFAWSGSYWHEAAGRREPWGIKVDVMCRQSTAPAVNCRRYEECKQSSIKSNRG